MMICESIRQLLYTCFEESSIHGLSLIVVGKKRLFIERLFWTICVGFCIFFTVAICWGQWSRFENNPIVLSLETNYRTWKYKSPLGITICSNFTDRRMARKIVESTWNISRNNPKFEYYEQFILAVSTAKYYNLDMFENFTNDKTLDSVDLLQVAYDMRKELHIPPSPEYINVITEMGVCHSTTDLEYIQKPYRINQFQASSIPKRETDNTIYCALDVVRLIITPHIVDTDNVTIYIHNKNDVISGADSLHQSLIESSDVYHNDVELHEISSTETIRGLPIKRRKCLYFDERVLHFFTVYTKNLCRIDCRIKAALLQCGCVPFFYNLNATEPTCNPSGLYCLSKSDWYSKNCECYPLCDSIDFVPVLSEKVLWSTYSRFIEITIISPKSRIKRQIIFSIYELIVSFGGGAAFFLGCSFLSSVEIAFFICEWLFSLRTKCIRKRALQLPEPFVHVHRFPYTN